MFVQITNDTLKAIANLKYASPIKVRPYKSGWQLVTDFPKNWIPFDRLRDKTGKVVVLKGPCMEGYAELNREKLSEEGPPIGCARTPDNQPVNLNDIALVIYERQDGQNFHVIAYYVSGIEQSHPKPIYLCYPTDEERAADKFGLVSSQCHACELED